MIPESEETVSPAETPPCEGVSDHSLLRRVQGGQPDASTELYLRYAHRLHALVAAQSSPELARRVDAEDIVQSVFRTFFRRAAHGHYSVPDGEEIWKLLLVIALNKVRAAGAYHRAAKRDVRMTAGNQGIERYPDPLHSNESATVLLKMSVEDALSQLSPQHKEVVELRMEGHEVAEIAQRTGRSKRSIERILQECRKKLARLLEDQ